MRLITKETDYAIRAVMNMGKRHGSLVSSATISDEEQIPLQFLRRILQGLIGARIVTSREGMAGGVRLRSKPERIRVLDIMRAFQGPVELSGCMFRKRICANRSTCVLRRRIKDIEKALAAQFAGISIADLLSDIESEKCIDMGVNPEQGRGLESTSAERTRGIRVRSGRHGRGRDGAAAPATSATHGARTRRARHDNRLKKQGAR